jgi:hypothetical protein
MAICSRTHKVAQELIRNGCLPRLNELGKNLVTEELVNAVQDNTNQTKQIVEAATFVSTTHYKACGESFHDKIRKGYEIPS